MVLGNMSFTQIRQGSLLKIIFSLTYGQHSQEHVTNPFNIDDLAEICFKFEGRVDNSTAYNTNRRNGYDPIKVLVAFRMSKYKLSKDSKVKLKVHCETLKYSTHFVCPEISTYWIDLGSFTIAYSETYVLEVSMIVNKTTAVAFDNLYDDTELTDFRLTATEGSVAMHKVCLAAHSEVFKAMICGTWKESTEGEAKVKGATLKTLEHLKEFLYLGILPDDGLQQLLLLAKYYMIENLKEECIMKLAQTVTSLSLYSLLQFVSENNIPELAFMLVQLTSNDVINSAHENNKVKPSVSKNPDIE